MHISTSKPRLQWYSVPITAAVNICFNNQEPNTSDIYASECKTSKRSTILETSVALDFLFFPYLPEPPFLTALVSCKLSCRLPPLRNTGYPMRKLTIHCGNRSPIKRQGKLPLTQHNIIPLLYKTQLSKQITFTEAWNASHIHKSFHSHIFTSLKMSIPITNSCAKKIFTITTN